MESVGRQTVSEHISYKVTDFLTSLDGVAILENGKGERRSSDLSQGPKGPKGMNGFG